MHSPAPDTAQTDIAAQFRSWTLRWLLTWTSELGMAMSRWTDLLQVKLDSEQEGHHD